jgi:glycosyltransferase involved in cell wall biosynthesis
MKILIATGIYRPDVGGPATVAAELARRLSHTGHEVTVITYSDMAQHESDTHADFKIIRVVRKKNKFLNYWRYFRIVKKELKKHAFIYSLDWFSGGMPVMIAARLAKKPYILRVGGAYLWEKYMNENNQPVTLEAFYREHLYRKFYIMHAIIKSVLSHAAYVVFNSEKQKVLYEYVYNLDSRKTLVIENAVPENKLRNLVHDFNSIQDMYSRDKEIVFIGRLSKVKNPKMLVDAFALFHKKHTEYSLVVIGDGDEMLALEKQAADYGIKDSVQFLGGMSQSALYQRIAASFLVVIPSWADISPNLVYECLALGIPFVLTQENYLSISPEIPIHIDPSSPEKLVVILEELQNPEKYAALTKKLSAIQYNRTWPQVVQEHLKLFQHVVSKNK